MKKKIALSMAAVMMLAFCACGRETVETTAPTIIPTETTIPGTVTQETIASEKLPVEMHPFYDALTASGFQYSRGALEFYSGSTEIGTSDVEFLFTGESNVIDLVTMDMTLTLPKDWMDRVAIYQVSANAAKEGSYNGYCYVINRDIIAANWDLEYVTIEDLLGGGIVTDYICCLSAVSKDEYFDDDPREPDYAIYLGESDTHYYYMKTPDTQNSNGSELLHTRYELLDRIGEDAYWELVGDLVITADEIHKMMEINNIPEETTEPLPDDTITYGYTFSFFYYNNSRYQAYCDYYIAPAGTEDWYPVYIDKDTIDWEHPRVPNAHKNDDVAVMRAFVAYDGPENTQWILRIGFPNEDVGTDFPDIPKPYSYQWDTVVEIQNNQTLLHLGFVPDYLTLSDDLELGAWYIPIAEPMEFCDNCPEHWSVPANSSPGESETSEN